MHKAISEKNVATIRFATFYLIAIGFCHLSSIIQHSQTYDLL